MIQQIIPRGRFDAISDGIFAIAMTIMVLEIKLPPHEALESGRALGTYLDTTIPTLITFAVSFFVLANLWVSHARLPLESSQISRKTAQRNFLFLFFVCLIPFATALINEIGFSPLSVLAFGVIIAGASLLLGFVRLQVLEQQDASTAELHIMRVRITLAAAIAVCGLVFTIIGKAWQPAIYIGYTATVLSALAFRYKQARSYLEQSSKSMPRKRD